MGYGAVIGHGCDNPYHIHSRHMEQLLLALQNWFPGYAIVPEDRLINREGAAIDEDEAKSIEPRPV